MEVNQGGANLLRLHIQVEQVEPVPKNEVKNILYLSSVFKILNKILFCRKNLIRSDMKNVYVALKF